MDGSTFTGMGEGSGGDFGPMSSPANLPRAYLRAMDTGNYGAMAEGSKLVDVSTSIYLAPFPAPSATALHFQVPASLSPGYYMFWVQSNAIPSTFTILNVYTPPLPSPKAKGFFFSD